MDSQRRRKQAQVLHPQPSAERFETDTIEPSPGLSWCVDYLWSVRWNIAGTHTQRVIPRTVVQLVAEEWQGVPRLVVYGVPTCLFERELSGAGRVVAASFRPGGFWPFVGRSAVEECGGSAAGLVDRVLPAEALIGVDDREIAGRLTDCSTSFGAAAAELREWLVALAPPVDPVAERVVALVDSVESNPQIASAHRLAEIAGVSTRTLQRWFLTYIGLSPKTVIQRHRLLDVAAAANAGARVDWAGLSAELGYYDQSHLIRHFRAMTGVAPGGYAELSRPFSRFRSD